jgi:hypothetical protein
MLIKFIPILVLSLAVSACGGGGGGGSDSPSAKGDVVTPPAIPGMFTFSMNENEVLEKDIGFAPDYVRIESGISAVQADISGQKLVVTAGEIDRELLVRIDAVRDGKVVTYAVVQVKNSSAVELVQKGEALDEQREELLNLEEAGKLFRYFVDVAYLGERITNSEKEDLIASFGDVDTQAYQVTSNALNSAYTAYRGYRAGVTDEYEFSEELESAELALDQYASQAALKFEALKGKLPELPDFSNLSFSFVTKEKRYSMFEGNPAFGDYLSDGTFQYSQPYSALQGFTFKGQTGFFCPF